MTESDATYLDVTQLPQIVSGLLSEIKDLHMVQRQQALLLRELTVEGKNS